MFFNTKPLSYTFHKCSFARSQIADQAEYVPRPAQRRQFGGGGLGRRRIRQRACRLDCSGNTQSPSPAADLPSPCRGSRKQVTLVPSPRVESSCTRPPCNSTKLFTRDRPRPTLRCRSGGAARRKVSNTTSWSASLMPTPLSAMDRATSSP